MLNIILIILGSIFLLLSLFFMICGILQWLDFKFKKNILLTATVKEYKIKEYDTDKDYYPIYEYEIDGEKKSYTAQTFSTNNPKYSIGEKVKMCYNTKKNDFVNPNDIYFSFNLAATLMSIALFILGIPLINFGIL